MNFCKEVLDGALGFFFCGGGGGGGGGGGLHSSAFVLIYITMNI